ncbi:MAG: FmdB family zinc ribbon protein, partial [Candidatus Binataceae bacterium]
CERTRERMPVYEYACGKCGHDFEAEQRITEPPIKTCPRCRARKVKRLISQTSFVLKGSGWYATDYARKGASSPKPDSAATGSESSSDTSNGAQPAAAATKTESSSEKPSAAKTTD